MRCCHRCMVVPVRCVRPVKQSFGNPSWPAINVPSCAGKGRHWPGPSKEWRQIMILSRRVIHFGGQQSGKRWSHFTETCLTHWSSSCQESMLVKDRCGGCQCSVAVEWSPHRHSFWHCRKSGLETEPWTISMRKTNGGCDTAPESKGQIVVAVPLCL
jgi:hypothetical protein